VKNQNEVLRPILKLQNDLFLAVFSHYITKKQGRFFTTYDRKKLAFIDHSKGQQI
jgi:hypothetical protein